MNKMYYWIVGGIAVILILFSWQYAAKAPSASAPVETASSTPVVATTTPTPAPVRPAATGPFPIHSADLILNWNFTGSYAGDDALIAQANADIAHLTGLLGTGQYDDYDLYIGIGNDKNLIGDGGNAYDNYNKAILVHPKKGLVYTNIGHLMSQLGAYYTAADAYAKATAVEPAVLEYHIERLNYLIRQFPDDATRVTAAFADAGKVFGDTAQTISIKARWLTDLKRYADAITAWETVKMISPGKDMTAIDAEIARLQAKQ